MLQNVKFSSLEEYEKKISGLGSDLDGQKKAYDEQLKGKNTIYFLNLQCQPLN